MSTNGPRIAKNNFSKLVPFAVKLVTSTGNEVKIEEICTKFYVIVIQVISYFTINLRHWRQFRKFPFIAIVTSTAYDIHLSCGLSLPGPRQIINCILFAS